MTEDSFVFSSDLPPGRQRWLALAKHKAAAMEAVRKRGLPAALGYVAGMGGATQRKSIAHGVVKIAATNPPAYRIQDGLVWCLNVTWRFAGRSRRQVAVVEYLPMWGRTGIKRRPLP